MKKFRVHFLIAAIFVMIGCAGTLFAQTPSLFLSTLTGNEQINVIEPNTGSGTLVTSPQILVVTAAQLRNGANTQLVPTGTTVTTQINSVTGKLLATGAITTWNVNLPLSPYDGQVIAISCPGGTASTVSVTATSPASVAITGTSFTSCTSGGAAANGAEWVYSLAANTWYRIQ